MDFQTLQKKDTQYIAGTYARVPLAITRGTGATCYDVDGKEYIDFTSGIGVNALGFAHPGWVQAVSEQLGLLAHMSNLYYTEPQVALAEVLCQRTKMEKVFFANSGAEANEGAIKAARKYSADRYGANRYEIVTLENSFHGRTITTLSATGQEVFHKNFTPFTEGFQYAQANNISDLESKITPKTCAILLELVQGEGGVIPLEQAYVDAVVALCKRQDILLLVDEVQTGIGRTGTLLCSEQYSIQPDIITLAKGLGGGLPLGAVLFGEKTAGTLGFGDHATTFGGNPAVTAGALVVLDELSDVFLKQVQEKGKFLSKELLKMPGVKEISGKGLMLGITLEDGLDNRQIVEKAGQQGAILLTAKHKLRMLPPLVITQQEMEQGLAVLAKVLEQEVAK